MELLLKEMGIREKNKGISIGLSHIDMEPGGMTLSSYSPIDGSLIAEVATASEGDYDRIVRESIESHMILCSMPAPKRGEIIRRI